MLELVEVGILEEEDIEHATSATFNPNRCGFEGKGEIWVENILNLGVSPSKLIEIMKTRFNSCDGVILEGLGVSSIRVYDDAAIFITGTESSFFTVMVHLLRVTVKIR
ncbi:hypothetical protein POM88_025618 [Heracleum sosnowskyi]|uniref:Uncharacterized protein n=1 Tax=Heracleum sosnowskyi TaxID=360622 RepID=A0AAD8MNB6_9APIA|nr:hypothetical protein POM88_025618 [Heracleum sosnowskyi]